MTDSKRPLSPLGEQPRPVSAPAMATGSKVRRCPLCAELRPIDTHAPHFPFCSPRCKQLDLGNWLDERYRVPTEDAVSSAGD